MRNLEAMVEWARERLTAAGVPELLAKVERLQELASTNFDLYHEAMSDGRALTAKFDLSQADLDAANAALDRVRALSTEITLEMQGLADKGRFRALWINLRIDLRAALSEPTEGDVDRG